MENLSNILNFIGIIIIAIGTIFVFDARILSKNFFPTNNVNQVTRRFKLIGSIFFFIGSIIFLV